MIPKGYTKQELKFLKSLAFWEYRTKVLEYTKLEDYALTVNFKDGRKTILGLTLTDLENPFEMHQFSDWIYVMCRKYKKKFIEINIEKNPETNKNQFINLFIG